jgi:hypothetical protein
MENEDEDFPEYLNIEFGFWEENGVLIMYTLVVFVVGLVIGALL